MGRAMVVFEDRFERRLTNVNGESMTEVPVQLKRPKGQEGLRGREMEGLRGREMEGLRGREKKWRPPKKNQKPLKGTGWEKWNEKGGVPLRGSVRITVLIFFCVCGFLYSSNVTHFHL